MFRFAAKMYGRLRDFFLRLRDRIFGDKTYSPQAAHKPGPSIKDWLTTMGGIELNVISSYVNWIQYSPQENGAGILDVNYLGTTCRYEGVSYSTARDVYMGRYPSKSRAHSIGNTARILLFPLPYTKV